MTLLPDEGPLVRSVFDRVLKPRWEVIPAATLTKASFNHPDNTFQGAVYRADGSLVLSSLRPSAVGHWRPVDPVTIGWPSPVGSDADVMADAIYGGHFFTMWGHFVLETLSTAAIADQLPHAPVIFTPFAPDPQGIVTERDFERRKELLAAAGWGGRELRLETSAVRFRRLIVAERLMVVAAPANVRSIAPEMKDVYRRVRSVYAGNVWPKKVVVARRPPAFARSHPFEEKVYSIFEEMGFTLMDGANLSIAEQIYILAEAKALIGFTGSNLHNSAFCHPGVTVVEIGDVRSYASSGDIRNYNQIALCDLLDQDLIFVDSFEEAEGALRPLSAERIVAQAANCLVV